MDSAKKRSNNFTSKEETVLVSLVRKFRDTIECKKTDRTTNAVKTEAWVKLAKEFNSICGDVYRDPKILKQKYENLKKRTKQKYADEKCAIGSTGGGTYENVPITTIDAEIKSIIGTQLTGRISEFDDDTQENIVMHEEADEYDRESNTFDIYNSTPTCATSKQDALPTDKITNNNWTKYTPAMLRTPKPRPLRSTHKENIPTATKNILSNKILDWATVKADQATQAERHREEEHQIRLKYMQEEHDLKMRVLNEEHTKKVELMEWECRERIRILEDTRSFPV